MLPYNQQRCFVARVKETGFRSDLFVGRSEEMDVAAALLSDVCDGKGGLLIVEGEPGIGKSRLVSELSRSAADRGMTVLVGRCQDGQAIPPYWPWVEILRTYYRTHEIPKGGEADIETALHTLLAKPRLGEPPTPFAGDMASKGFLLQDAVIRHLKNTSVETPFVIVLEDIHNADVASLSLLDILAQSIEMERIGLIITFRTAQLLSESRLAESVGEMAKLSNCQRVHLTGLGSDDVRELIRSVAGLDVSENAVSAVYSHTDGNCLFVKELVRALMDEIRPDSPEPLEVEKTVRHHSVALVPLIAKRLRGLPEKSRRILETASLLGREFSLRKLSAVVGSEIPEDLHAALEAARRLAFIEHMRGETDKYSFVHALYQDALTAGLGPAIAARRRCAIGLALEDYYQENADDHAAELARFLADAQTERENERCYHYSLIAGEQAWARFAVDDMQAFSLKAYDLREFRKTEEELATIYQALAVTFTMMRQAEHAARMYMNAWECHFNAGEVKKGLDLVTKMSPGWMDITDPDSLLRILARALTYAEPESADAADIMALNAVAEHYRGGGRTAEGWMDESLEIARRLNDPASLIRVLEKKGFVMRSYRKARWDELRAVLLEIIDLEPEDPIDPTIPTAGRRTTQREDLVEQIIGIGKVRDARPFAHRLLPKEREYGMPSGICRALHAIMDTHRLEGNWDDARRYCDEALAEKKINNACNHACTLGDRAILEYQLGRFDEGAIYAEAMRETSREIRSETVRRLKRFGREPRERYDYRYNYEYLCVCLDSTIALITGIDNGLSAYREVYQERLNRLRIESAREWVGLDFYIDCYPLIGVATEAILKTDAGLAMECYEVLKHDPSTMLYPRFWFSDIKGRLLGLLKLTMGDAGAAIGYFDECCRFCREEGLKPMLAWVCYDYARALFLRGYGEDHATAEHLLDEGLSIASELQMKPVESRIIDLLAERSGDGKPRYPDGLTAREVEVLRHVAIGKTNQEIGRDLNISENTVSNHIKHAFVKTGTTNRVAAASYAVRAGLVPEELTD
jgi:DNA-binding CsgD family transcriptional regulator